MILNNKTYISCHCVLNVWLLFESMLCQLTDQLRPQTGNLLEFFSLLVYISLCLPVYENHKYCLVWEHVVSVHGSDTALNRKFLGIFFCFYLFVLILFRPINTKHKHLIFWKHVVSACGAATALNRLSLGIFLVKLWLYWFYVFLFMKIIDIFLFGSTLCQLMYQLRP